MLILEKKSVIQDPTIRSKGEKNYKKFKSMKQKIENDEENQQRQKLFT
jgi:hypothetical protein